jgi:ATP-binding cassette subfamily B (MDR/TAP) protein 1
LSFWYGGKLLDQGVMNIGDMIKVFGGLLMASIGFIQLFAIFPEVAKAQASISILLKIIKRVPAIPYKGGKTVDELKGHIAFENVTFRYPSRKNVVVLSDFSLNIEPGQSVALVGQSGSGKSTIVGLLEKWYEPEAGTITLDGVNLAEVDPQWLHRYLGIVSQEPVLFATTIRRNITYAVDTINMSIRDHEKKKNPNITDEELSKLLMPVNDDLIQQAAISANAHDFVSKLPDGYDTIIGERGVSLSGGQKQRIAIARSVLQNPKILLLDEATSALDTKSEALVQDALEKLMVARTCIVIAHRLTTVQDCDKIVVMQRGKIMEIGSHNELIKIEKGHYWKLAQKQMKFGQRTDSSSDLSANNTSDSESDDMSTDDVHVQLEEQPEQQQLSAAVVTPSAVLTLELDQVPAPKRRKFGRKLRHKKAKKLEDFTNEEDIVDDREPKVYTTLSLFRLIGFEWIFVIVAAVFSFIQGSLPIIFYVLFSRVISAVTPIRNADGSTVPYPPGFSIAGLVAEYAGYMTILAVGGSISSGIAQFSTALANERLRMRLKHAYFTAIINQEMSFFDIKKSGKLLSSIDEDVQAITDGLTIKLSLFMTHVAQLVLGVILALIACWQLALIMMACIFPITGITMFLAAFLINKCNAKILKLAASALSTANEVIGSIRTVRSMAGEEREQRRFDNDLRKILHTTFLKALTVALSLGTIEYCIWSVNALGFWYGGKLVASGQLAAGSLFQVLVNMILVIFAVSFAMAEVQHFYKAHTCAMEMLRVTKRVPAIPIKGGKRPEKLDGHIELKNVTFAYPARPNIHVMKNFTLDIRKGQHVALVGESGSGKSTITALIERFYDPIEGQVFIDGTDIRELDPVWLHKHVAIVTQEPQLFATTIRNNITYAMDHTVPIEKIHEAAKAANCFDFIQTLPNGFDTMIGERGVSMSGGQKQRIAIARAMLQDTAVLLLDEATSALDAEAESLVQEALDKLMVGRTTIVIAHRLSTVQDCDLIVAMRQGEVIEMGTHDELIKKKGMYFKLAQKQMEFGMNSGDKKHAPKVKITEDD